MNFMTIATMTAMMGMAANTAIESSTLFWNAMKAAPTNMMGAIMAIVMLHEGEALELLDVVGRARDEGRGAELSDFAQTERGNPLVDGAAQVASEPHGSARGA